MMKKSVLFSQTNCADLQEILNRYDPVSLNKCPMTEIELFKMYEDNTDAIVAFIRDTTKDNVFFLGNEVRAMFGHLADYRITPENRKNLYDAYGHFRRLNIDALKILCNELDRIALSYFKTHKHYDYNDVNDEFLFKYSTGFFEAQKAYLDAQLSERTGSDRSGCNIISKYHFAAVKYSELMVYLKQNRKGIERAKWLFLIKTAITFLGAVLGLVLSFLI